MAINPENFKNLSFDEIHGIQKVYIEDYLQAKLGVEIAAEVYKSGQTDSKPALKAVKSAIRVKLAILEDINAIGRILDERDGTISTSVN